MTVDAAVAKADHALEAHFARQQDQQFELMIACGHDIEDADDFLVERRAQFDAWKPGTLAILRRWLLAEAAQGCRRL